MAEAGRVEITVAIPTHNRAETVVMAVRSALAQTRAPRRVLVLADGCTDDTVAACRALGDERVDVRDLPKEAGYGYVHRNIPLHEAGDNEVIAWLGDDDMWMPDHLERVGELFDVDEADIVTSTSALIAPDGSITPTGSDFRVPWLFDQYAGGEQRTPSAAIALRPDTILRLGGWQREPSKGGDYLLWTRILQSGARPGFVNVPTVVFSRSSDRDQSWPDHVAQNAELLRQVLDPVEVVRLRHRFVLEVSRRNAEMERARRQLDEWVTQLNAELHLAVSDRDAIHAELERERARPRRRSLRGVIRALRS